MHDQYTRSWVAYVAAEEFELDAVWHKPKTGPGHWAWSLDGQPQGEAPSYTTILARAKKHLLETYQTNGVWAKDEVTFEEVTA